MGRPRKNPAKLTTVAAVKQAKVNTPITPEQVSSFNTILDKMKALHTKHETNSIVVSYGRGKYANEILQNPVTYGKRKVAELAAQLNIKSLQLKWDSRFAAIATEKQIEEMKSLSPPPSVRMIGKCMAIKDEAIRQKVFTDIVGGTLKSSGFDEQLRAILGRGPKKPRRPSNPTVAFKKVGATAITICEQFGWLEKAAEGIHDLDNGDKDRAVDMATQSLDALKQLKDKLNVVIEKVEQVVN